MERQFSAGGIVIKTEEGRSWVLLIKDSYGHWIWPKGHIEQGETPEETAIREVSEETGLKSLQIVERIGKQEYGFFLEGKHIFKTVCVFLIKAEPREEISVQKSEIAEGCWFSPEEALKTIEYEGSRNLLKKAIDLWNK